MPCSDSNPRNMSSCRGRLSPRRSRSPRRPSSRSSWRGPWTTSEDLVREIPLPEHPLFPALDVRDGVGENLERVVRWNDRHAEHVPEGDEHEEMLQVHPGTQGGRHMTVRRHPVEDALHALLDFSAARLCLRRLLRIGHLVPFLTVAMRAGLDSFDA